jgi:exopolyphosphatase/guanosine-5'-triphosphate,3'-diphosphate pyrophosphatase
MERVAVADLGSNSWRLVVYGYEPGTPWWSPVDEIREAVRVGAGMGEERLLRPDRIDRAVHTAAVFASFCRASGIDAVEVVATSAIRDAANSDELLDAIRERTGLVPRVISGREEGRYGWLAIANSTTIADGFGLDIGGGSIQVMRLDDRRLAQADSLPLGSVRVSEEFLPGEKAPAKAMKALRKRVETELEALGWWGQGGRLVGIGGTIRNLAVAAMRRAELPVADPQGFTLDRAALEELIELLAGRPASKRGELSGIKPDRGDVILGGALVLAATLDSGGFDAIEVTEACAKGSSSSACSAIASCSTTCGASPWRTSLIVSTASPSTSAAWRRSRSRCSTGSPRPGCMSSATPSASCSGRPACSTTSARRSTTRTTTATRPT